MNKVAHFLCYMLPIKRENASVKYLGFFKEQRFLFYLYIKL